LQNIITIVLGVKVLSLQYDFVFNIISFFSIFSLHI